MGTVQARIFGWQITISQKQHLAKFLKEKILNSNENKKAMKLIIAFLFIEMLFSEINLVLIIQNSLHLF